MIKSTALCAVAAVVATVGVFAASATASAEVLKAKVVQKNGETVYCVNEAKIDSKIPARTCLTKDQWSSERDAKVAMIKDSSVYAANTSFAAQN